MVRQKKKAFRLVELIVTITIVAILWAIWFITELKDSYSDIPNNSASDLFDKVVNTDLSKPSEVRDIYEDLVHPNGIESEDLDWIWCAAWEINWITWTWTYCYGQKIEKYDRIVRTCWRTQ